MANRITVGRWQADRERGVLEDGVVVRNLEPKAADLLFLLAERAGAVVSRDEIFAALWPGVTVGQDSLSACVAKLRSALGDSARNPQMIETIPKRGYRLIATVGEVPSAKRPRAPSRWRPLQRAAAVAAACAALLPFLTEGWVEPANAHAAQLTRRAHDHYFQFRRADNEAAIRLYERVIRDEPAYGPAYAGLANALVQQVVRWPDRPGAPDPFEPSLYEAVASGRTSTPMAKAKLDRALDLAKSGVSLAPSDPAAHKALGLVHGARGEISEAARSFEQAVEIDPDGWDSLLNLAEIDDLQRNPTRALDRLEAAYAAMSRVYDTQAVRLRIWYPETGAMIADRHASAGRLAEAAQWYRRVLDLSPLHPSATGGLARVLMSLGRPGEARQLCTELAARIGPGPYCS